MLNYWLVMYSNLFWYIGFAQSTLDVACNRSTGSYKLWACSYIPTYIRTSALLMIVLHACMYVCIQSSYILLYNHNTRHCCFPYKFQQHSNKTVYCNNILISASLADLSTMAYSCRIIIIISYSYSYSSILFIVAILYSYSL